MKKAATIMLAILLLTNLSTSPTAFAWNPATDVLSGTDSSTDYSIVGALLRFDIDSTIAGIQIGEDAESIAFLLVINDFKIPPMPVGDQYQVAFTISSTDFTLLFITSGIKAGVLTLSYKDTASSSWDTGETMSVSAIGSGVAVRSVQGNIGLTLTTGTSVKLVVAKAILYELGGTETAITGIFGATFENGDGTPGSGGAIPNDRCPASEGATFSLLQGIDDFPHGTLVLAIPVMGLYVLFSRKKRKERR